MGNNVSFNYCRDRSNDNRTSGSANPVRNPDSLWEQRRAERRESAGVSYIESAISAGMQNSLQNNNGVYEVQRGDTLEELTQALRDEDVFGNKLSGKSFCDTQNRLEDYLREQKVINGKGYLLAGESFNINDFLSETTKPCAPTAPAPPRSAADIAAPAPTELEAASPPNPFASATGDNDATIDPGPVALEQSDAQAEENFHPVAAPAAKEVKRNSFAIAIGDNDATIGPGPVALEQSDAQAAENNIQNLEIPKGSWWMGALKFHACVKDFTGWNLGNMPKEQGDRKRDYCHQELGDFLARDAKKVEDLLDAGLISPRDAEEWTIKNTPTLAEKILLSATRGEIPTEDEDLVDISGNPRLQAFSEYANCVENQKDISNTIGEIYQNIDKHCMPQLKIALCGLGEEDRILSHREENLLVNSANIHFLMGLPPWEARRDDWIDERKTCPWILKNPDKILK